jgi:3,4-dihydroxy 2-butanone 4-phosphate synthase/GTP cyclohydrolase II
MSNLQRALAAYKNGDLIIVTDDADRENEGDLMLLAEKATPEKVAFMVRHTTGILCVALTQERARTLRLPLMVEENQDSKKTAFTVSVDYKVGITTGVSATERSNTVRALADTAVTHADFIRPGHIFPLIADAGGLQARGGHTEAGVALSHLVGAQPVCLLSEIVNDDGSMSRGASLDAFAAQHSIPMISVEELKGVAPVVPSAATSFEFAWAQLPLRTGLWSIATFPGLRQREHAVKPDLKSERATNFALMRTPYNDGRSISNAQVITVTDIQGTAAPVVTNIENAETMAIIKGTHPVWKTLRYVGFNY